MFWYKLGEIGFSKSKIFKYVFFFFSFLPIIHIIIIYNSNLLSTKSLIYYPKQYE